MLLDAAILTRYETYYFSATDNAKLTAAFKSILLSQIVASESFCYTLNLVFLLNYKKSNTCRLKK